MTAESCPNEGKDRPLHGQAAIVTGGGSGIGRAACVSLADAGASVAIADFNIKAAEETARLLADQAGGDHVALPVDVRVEEKVDAMVQSVLDCFGRLDILVHCAAILRTTGSGPRILPDVTPEEMNAVIDTNLKGTFLCNRAAVRPMIARRSGQIVNISSTSGKKGRAFDSVYCASKFGVVGLSESLAEEVRRYGIRVQAILPDAVDTPLWDQNGPIRAPADSLSPDRIALIIRFLLTLPADMMLENVVVMPFTGRRRRTQKATAHGAEASGRDGA